MAAKEDGGLKRMLGEDESVAKRRWAPCSCRGARYSGWLWCTTVCCHKSLLGKEWGWAPGACLLVISLSTLHPTQLSIRLATAQYAIRRADGIILPCCREELVARLQMLTKAKEELMDANY